MSLETKSLLLHAGLPALTIVPVLPGTTAFADIYSVRVVSGTQGESFGAGDDYGDYVLNASFNAESWRKCGSLADPAGNSCYETYYAGLQQTIYSFTAPTLPSDPMPIAGSGCNFSLASYEVKRELCNNGHQIVSGLGYTLSHPQGLLGLSDGPQFRHKRNLRRKPRRS